MGSNMTDISPNFVHNEVDAAIVTDILKFEATPFAIEYFAHNCRRLSDYAYWFTLGTLWVSYSGQSDLNLWRQLFRSDRPKRNTSLMKPSEWEAFKQLPERICVYRAHQPGETDWISYTTDRLIAERFARQKRTRHIVEYEIQKRDLTALFQRRGEQEILMLNPARARKWRQQ